MWEQPRSLSICWAKFRALKDDGKVFSFGHFLLNDTGTIMYALQEVFAFNHATVVMNAPMNWAGPLVAVFLLWQVACVARFNGQICLCLETTDNDTLPRTKNSSLRAKCLLHRSFTPRSAAHACGKTSSYHNGVTICLYAQKILAKSVSLTHWSILKPIVHMPESMMTHVFTRLDIRTRAESVWC